MYTKYTMLASRVKTNILAINVTIKLLLREIFRFIFSLYMKKSDILAINVIIKLPKMGIWRLIFSQYMKKSNILALLITRLSLAFIFTFKIYIKTCDMFRLSALFSQIFIFSHYMKKSNILAINVIIKLQERAIWRNILTFWSGDLKTHIQKKSNILAINVIIKLQETSIAIRERERGTGVLTLYYFYSSPDTIQCSLSLSLCETTALSQWERTHHLKSDPEGIRYPCSSCEYKSRNKGKLNSHIQVKHKGGSQKFPCSQCEYKASII